MRKRHGVQKGEIDAQTQCTRGGIPKDTPGRGGRDETISSWPNGSPRVK